MPVLRLLRILAVTLLFGSIASAQSGGLRYSLTDLNRYFKGTASWAAAFGINDAGQVVGTYVIGSNQYCFIYKAKTVTAFSSSASPLWCDGRAINAAGDVGGSMHMSNGLVNAFLRTSAGTVSTYTSIYGFNSFGWGIDNAKNVVGEMDRWDSTDNVAVPYGSTWSANPWVPPGYFLPNPSDDFEQSVAYGTDPTGKWVTVFGEDSSPYLFNIPTQTWTYLYCATFSSDNIPYAVNTNGHAVGQGECLGAYTLDAMLWTPAPIDLGFPPSSGHAISSDDWIVGFSGALAGGRGFLRVSDPSCPTMVDLTTLLNTTGWTVIDAYGINTTHQIAAVAKDSTGHQHAVLLTPVNSLPLCQH